MRKLLLGGNNMFKRLFDIREENDLTQEDVGKILNVSRVAISQWESGKEIIPLEKLNTFANHFNLSFDYLANISDIKQYNNTSNDLDPILIGKRLKQLRTKNNLTLRDLAEILNTSSSTISAYETGKTLILTSFAYELAVKFNISLDWICGKTK